MQWSDFLMKKMAIQLIARCELCKSISQVHDKTFVSSNISNWPITIDQAIWWTTKFFYLIFDYVLSSPVFTESDFIISEFILTIDLIILLLSLWFWLSISVNRNTKFDAKRWSILDANVLEQLFWQWYIT